MTVNYDSKIVAAACVLLIVAVSHAASPSAPPTKVVAPFHYVWGKAYEILPETNNNGSGYFSLCEGLNGRVYIGTAKYGVDAYLVEFDPQTEKQRIVIDAKAVTGDPGHGYAAQAKIHTRNYVGPSGTIYVGTKQGYASREEKERNDIPPYRGGYLLTYDPRTDKVTNLGMPWPGFGIIDVVADERHGEIYSVMCEDPYSWMAYDVKAKHHRWLGPDVAVDCTTLLQPDGRADQLTNDFKLVRYNPETNKLTTQDIQYEGKTYLHTPTDGNKIPYWKLASDGKSAYLTFWRETGIYRIDLTPEPPAPVVMTLLGPSVPGHKDAGTSSGFAIAPDGMVYMLASTDNPTDFGIKNWPLHHLIRINPANNQIADLGVIAIKTPGFADFGGDPNNTTLPNHHGFQLLPDGTLTLHHNHMALIAAHDGTLYATLLYPFTLFRIDPAAIPRAP